MMCQKHNHAYLLLTAPFSNGYMANNSNFYCVRNVNLISTLWSVLYTPIKNALGLLQ